MAKLFLWVHMPWDPLAGYFISWWRSPVNECLQFKTSLRYTAAQWPPCHFKWHKHSGLSIQSSKPFQLPPYMSISYPPNKSHIEVHNPRPTWSRWASCKTPDLWTPGLWEPEVCSKYACRRGGRNLCRWICRGTRPRKEQCGRVIVISHLRAHQENEISKMTAHDIAWFS